MSDEAAKQGSSRFKFLTGTISELKKVVWLPRREVAYLTFLVLLVSVIASLFLGAFDYGFTKLVDTFFIGK
jgi:preprotein translocase SecE subunit